MSLKNDPGKYKSSLPFGEVVSTFDQSGREIGRTLYEKTPDGRTVAVDISNQIGIQNHQNGNKKSW